LYWCSLAGSLLFASGCGVHAVSRAEELYTKGDYVGAAEVFEQAEARYGSFSNGERVQFALYRGATLLSLGDYAAAQRWSQLATRLNQQSPGTLSQLELAMLEQTRNTAAQRLELERTHGAAEQLVAASSLDESR